MPQLMMMEATIPRDQIDPRPGNRAQAGIDDEKLQELAQSIADQGLVQPILVRAVDGDRYEIIAGERRYRAAGMAGLEEIPVRVAPADASEEWIELAAIVENVQRHDIHPMDESDGYQRLAELGNKPKDIAEKVGRRVEHIRGRMSLQRLIPEARELFLSGKSGFGVAEIIAKCPPKLQGKAVKELVKPNSWRNRPDQLNWWLRDQTDVLSEAPFDIDDELLTDAPKCGDCPLRVLVSQRDLFDEVSEQDRCGDRTCWKKKTKAHVDNSRQQLETEGRKFVEASSVYASKKKKGVWYPDDWQESDAKNARFVLVIDGPDAGAIKRGTKRKTPSYRDDYEERRRQEEQHKAQRQSLLVAVNDALTPERVEELLADENARRRIAIQLAGHYESVEHLPAILPNVDADNESHYRASQKVEDAIKGAGPLEAGRWIIMGYLAQHTTRYRKDDDPLLHLAVEWGIVEPEPTDEPAAVADPDPDPDPNAEPNIVTGEPHQAPPAPPEPVEATA